MDLSAIVLYLTTTLLLVLEANTEPVSCISCVWQSTSTSTPRDPCYGNPANATSVRCALERYYCQTLLVHYEGGRTVIQRGCADPFDDVHKTTRHTPQHPGCEVKRNPSNNRLEARCFYACKSNNCNNVTLARVRLCRGDCSVRNGAGQCNYKTGRCVCREGWYGPNCENEVQSSRVTRRCVQCNGKLDDGCENARRATLCPANIGTYKYCTTTRTVLFDKDQNQVDSFISRGCSSTFNHANRCQFVAHAADSLSIGAIGYTCSSTCDHDGCNTNMPDGNMRRDERKDLHCVVCESDDDSSACAVGSVARSRCPSNTRYCKSSVTYYISDKKDLNYEAEPVYKFGKIVRKCGGHRIESKCREHKLGEFLGKKVKCEQTCDADGCNTGWPHRPLCSQCTSNVDQTGVDVCLSNPLWPSQCSKPYERFCVTINRNVKNRGTEFVFKSEIERKCSYHDLGQTCRNSSLGSVEVKTCNSTCSESGCNFKAYKPANRGSATFSVTSSFLLIGLLLALQFFNDFLG